MLEFSTYAFLFYKEMDDAMMSAHPTVPFSFIQSKTDIVQQSFYIAVGATTPNTTATITPTEYVLLLQMFFVIIFVVLMNFLGFIQVLQRCERDLWYLQQAAFQLLDVLGGWRPTLLHSLVCLLLGRSQGSE